MVILTIDQAKQVMANRGSYPSAVVVAALKMLVSNYLKGSP